jgi:hypothetical protein
MFLHNSFSHNRLEQNELDLPQAKFGFWVQISPVTVLKKPLKVEQLNQAVKILMHNGPGWRAE